MFFAAATIYYRGSVFTLSLIDGRGNRWVTWHDQFHTTGMFSRQAWEECVTAGDFSLEQPS